ncbi:MAG: AraC family transcriptional regulator [Pirellulales bacterium]|nr:AraC family transcriptional regulator [Pirellulales bacterium]
MSNPPIEYFRYLPTSDRDRQWGLYVVGAGYQRVLPGQDYPPRGHPKTHDFQWQRGRVLQEFQAVYIVAGEGVFESKPTGRLAVGEGNVILLFPGIWHRYAPVSERGWDVYWMAFQGEDAQRLWQREFLRPEQAVLETGLDDTILHPFTTMLDRIRSERIGFQQLIAADALEIVAGVLAALRRQRTSSHHTEVVRRTKMELEKQSEGIPVIEDLADDMHISVSHLHHIFKEHTGLSPYQYHLQLKIQRAKEMLHDSGLHVKQIARILGFQDVYHFSKIFKRKTGVSPLKWRTARQMPSGLQPPGKNARPRSKKRETKGKGPAPRADSASDPEE